MADNSSGGYINGDGLNISAKDRPLFEIKEPETSAQSGQKDFRQGISTNVRISEPPIKNSSKGISNFEIHPPIEKVKPENLYEPDRSIVKCREIMKIGDSFLLEAITTQEEITREHQLDLFWNKLYELQDYIYENSLSTNLEEGTTILQTVLYNHRTSPLNEKEIRILRKVFRVFMDNINVPSDILDKSIDELEEVGFDLEKPLADVENLHELE